MELYDIETGTEVYREGVFIAPSVQESASPESMTAAVKTCTAHVLSDGKIPVVLGGEHSVSIGAIKACAEAHPNLAVLHIDAHADLRPSYMGSECNHACAVHWASQHCTLVQVGIRSMDVTELPFIQDGCLFTGDNCRHRENETWQAQALEALGQPERPIYITVDLDAFDPAYLPDTGTPEPGGLDWFQVIGLIRKASEKFDVIGFDIVELAAHAGSKPSDFLAAKLLYKMLTYSLNPTPIQTSQS